MGTIFLHCLLFSLRVLEKRRGRIGKKELHNNKEILLEAVKDIQFGSVTVHIQDGKIVYIEKTEKIKVQACICWTHR